MDPRGPVSTHPQLWRGTSATHCYPPGMDPTLLGILGLIVNAILAIITGVYAVLTRQLTKSSAAAATSALESARSAADSARAQRAAIEAEVNRRHAWFKTSGGGRYEDWNLLVIPLVGAYVLRRVVLRDFEFRPRDTGEDGSHSNVHVDVNLELQPKGSTLPMHVDEIEGAWFSVNLSALAHQAQVSDDWMIVNWSCEVTFSLSEFTDSQRRIIVYHDQEADLRLRRVRESRELGLD